MGPPVARGTGGDDDEIERWAQELRAAFCHKYRVSSGLSPAGGGA
jgi:hypothetical protein